MAERTSGGYYATIPAPVLDDPSLRYASMVLYAKIVNYAKQDGYCYAKNEELRSAMERVDPETGAVSSVTERTLQSWLAELKAAGHIVIDNGPLPYGSIGRRIFIGAANPRKAPQNRGEKNFTPENFFTGGVKKTSSAIKGINNNIKKTPISPGGDREVRNEIEKEILAYAGDDKLLLDALHGFAEQRAKRKKEIKTLRQLHILLNKLNGLSKGDSAAKIRLLDEATEHGWDSVYARDDRRGASSAQPEETPKARRYVRTDIVNGEEVDIYE